MTTAQNARRLRLRGNPAARAQWRFNCAIHNLLKLHRNGGLARIQPHNIAQDPPPRLPRHRRIDPELIPQRRRRVPTLVPTSPLPANTDQRVRAP